MAGKGEVLRSRSGSAHGKSRCDAIGAILPRFPFETPRTGFDAFGDIEAPGGRQRIVETGRALVSEPTMPPVNGPAAGLSRMLAQEVCRMPSNRARRENPTILPVDREIRRPLEIADGVSVLAGDGNKLDGPVSEFHGLGKAVRIP